MSQITVQCRLVASVSTRHHLWKLMADLNTPLINELLAQMAQHPEFETWRKKGRLPAGIIKQLCQPLKIDPRFANQPARFYASAIALVEYIYKSWFKLQQRLEQKLKGQTHWLEMLKSDEELTAESNTSIEVIRSNATQLLSSLSSKEGSISTKLWKAYNDTDNILTRCVIRYLLKNGSKVPKKLEENLEKLAKRHRKAEIKIERLKRQLESRIPKGRDLTGKNWLETLAIASTTAPQDESEAKSWQDTLLTKSKLVPFPVAYETNEDLTWSKNEKGRLCVQFNGLSKHTFQIYCDQRQLEWFQRFYEDQEIKKASKNEYSSGLFTLRSGLIAWQKGTDKGEPQNIHHLILYCSVDTRLWTAEGTEQVCQEKAEDIAKTLTNIMSG
jgi:phosphoribosyl-AMP cyclohydrolase